jgi:hypothetical protein
LPINPFLAQHHKICGAVPIFAPIMFAFNGISEKSTTLHHKRLAVNVIEPFSFQFFPVHPRSLLFTVSRGGHDCMMLCTSVKNSKFSHLIAAFEMYLIGEERCIKIEPSS